MLDTNSFDTDKRLLGTVFVFLFCVSLVLIVFERVNNLESARKTAYLGVEQVQGVAIQQSDIDQYRQLLQKAANILFLNIESQYAGGAPDVSALDSVYQSLLAMRVPPLYRDAHFSLVLLAQSALSGKNAVADFKRAQTLRETYSWLSSEIINL